jgi:hypothetical protein
MKYSPKEGRSDLYKEYLLNEKFYWFVFKLSNAHMRAIFTEYKKKTGKEMEDSIKSEMSFNLKKTYLSLSNILF